MAGAPQASPAEATAQDISLSIFKKRWLKFKTLKRGYYSLIFLTAIYALSFFFPLLINTRALVVSYEGERYYPAVPLIGGYIAGKQFGQDVPGEANYRQLKADWQAQGGSNWVMLVAYPYGPYEDITSGNKMFESPSREHWFGTDNTGRDVFARMMYGFRISLSFAIILVFFEYIIGVSIGGAMGYFGGKFDLLMQRFIEIWTTVPFFFLVIIISSIIKPNFLLLIVILAMFGWIGMTYYIRAEFYREKTKDYVAAAISMGQSNVNIIFKHILPNSLVPIITYFPFAMVGGIEQLVGLDFLGFGLPPPTPSWGQMVSVGIQNITKWWMVAVPLGALFMTLMLITFIGEAVREAFDPKVFSRLR